MIHKQLLLKGIPSLILVRPTNLIFCSKYMYIKFNTLFSCTWKQYAYMYIVQLICALNLCLYINYFVLSWYIYIYLIFLTLKLCMPSSILTNSHRSFWSHKTYLSKKNIFLDPFFYEILCDHDNDFSREKINKSIISTGHNT